MDQSVRLRSIDCLTMIEQRLPALSGASRRVGETIVRDPWAMLGMTIYDVAAASGVSLPSVTRFCRAVGYPGFRDLVQGIAQSLGRTETKDLEQIQPPAADGGLAGLATEIVQRQIEALQTTLRTLDFDQIERAVEAIAHARRVTVIGHGAAYVSALGVSVKLNWGGIWANPATPDLFSNQVVAVGPEDVVIGISHQGRTRDTIEMLRLARCFGATTIGVTTVPHSPLEEVADIAIAVLSPDVVRAGTFLIAYNALMVLADLLAAAVTERRWGGSPPNRDKVVEWIETNLRVGPISTGRGYGRRERIPTTPTDGD
ncbi:MAG: MurR/RpiR family transcriptional regulator [Thermomicrobiales bacterium]